MALSEESRVGLCLRCQHVRRRENAKSSVFYQCGRAAHDARLQPYPPLPVLACPGFERRGGETSDEEARKD